MTFLRDKHYMHGTIVAMAAKMPEVILTEYGLFLKARDVICSLPLYLHEVYCIICRMCALQQREFELIQKQQAWSRQFEHDKATIEQRWALIRIITARGIHVLVS